MMKSPGLVLTSGNLNRSAESFMSKSHESFSERNKKVAHYPRDSYINKYLNMILGENVEIIQKLQLSTFSNLM